MAADPINLPASELLLFARELLNRVHDEVGLWEDDAQEHGGLTEAEARLISRPLRAALYAMDETLELVHREHRDLPFTLR